MSTDGIQVQRDGRVMCIRFSDPGTRNALTPALAQELRALLGQAERECGAVLLTGDERAFSSGANLAGAAMGGLEQLDLGEALESAFNPLMLALKDLQVPLVTAVRGVAAGIGASVALMGDLIVAGRSAFFLQAFGKVGLVPDGGAAWLLARAVGRVRAMELMLLGERLPAETAFQWGLVTRLVADAEVEPTALELARRLAGGPATALRLTRQAAWAGAGEGFASQLELEAQLQRRAGKDPDFVEGVTAFLEKRPPRFGGR